MRSSAIIWLYIAIFSMSQCFIFSEDSNGGTSTKTSVDYIKRWITRAILSKEDMRFEDLSRNARRVIKEAEKEMDNLKKAFDTEREMTLLLQGFIDITFKIKLIFQYRWPKWAPRPKDKEIRSIHSWTILLLHIEDPIIFKIRVLLQRRKMNVPEFVEKIKAFMIVRNDEAHNELERKDASEAYKYVEQFADTSAAAGLDKNALNVLVDALGLVNRAENVLQFTSHENSSVLEIVNGERNNYNVLHFAEVSSYRVMEEALLKRVFESAITFEDESRKPLAYLTTEHTPGWFILFQSFEDAYYAWSNRDKLKSKFPPSVVNSITIRNLKENPLWSGNIYIKVELNETTIDEFKEMFPIHNAEEIRCAGSSKYTLILLYKSSEFAMLDYEKLKHFFPPKNVQFLKLFPTYTHLPTIAHIKRSRPF